MTRFRLLIVAAAGALFVGGASVAAGAGATALTANDSHGDSVASAARTTCPHGQDNEHGACVSAVAKSNEPVEAPDTADPCKAADPAEDQTEKASAGSENSSEKAAKTGKTADKTEDSTEKSNRKAEDKAEKAKVKACEAATPET